jgi:hypothetical protein
VRTRRAVFGISLLSLVGVVVGSSIVVRGQAPAPPAAPTFTKDVAPILYKNCTTCHRPGEIAPMSLLTYDDARPWARSIRDRVLGNQMPPWHADPSVGHWVNERRLSDKEKETIARWVTLGAPKGDPADMPPLPKYTDGWNIGKPDAVFTMAEAYNVPASGTIEYQYFDVPTKFTEDKWIQAIEVRPGNRSVVHHVIVFYQEPGEDTRSQVIKPGPGMGKPRQPVDPNAPPAPKKEQRNLGNMLGGLAPGTEAMILPPGTARLVKAGSTLTFQMHYTANGTAATDRTSIGIKFAPAPPETEIRETALLNQNFTLPAGSTASVEASMTVTDDVTLWSLLPHTHLRGRSWKYDVTYPDGRNEQVLSVPAYDFNWQTEYWFKAPLKLPKGSKLHAIATYDNSASNPSNPDPKANVSWGDQTWEEMMFTGISFSVDKDKRPSAPTSPIRK